MSIPILQEQPSFGSAFSQQFGQGLGEGLQRSLENFHKNKSLQAAELQFIQQGYPAHLAKLAAVASTGGQTELLKAVLEEKQRSPQGMITERFAETPEEERFSVNDEEGLTPKEKVRREEGRYAKQSEKYGELSEKSGKLQQEQMRLQRLQELNEGGNLPKGLGRLNVNLKSGELTLPFVASPDAQEFVKIVNDFLAGAKDTFGARVTNFEVNRFLRRLPSLLNTEEGRRRVLRQMEIINQLNNSHNQGILDEFDSKGGVRKIDFDVAVRNARKKHAEETKRLQKEYVTGTVEEKKGGEITEDIAVEILRQAKGDREKARKIAKKRGYKF